MYTSGVEGNLYNLLKEDLMAFPISKSSEDRPTKASGGRTATRGVTRLPDVLPQVAAFLETHKDKLSAIPARRIKAEELFVHEFPLRTKCTRPGKPTSWSP